MNNKCFFMFIFGKQTFTFRKIYALIKNVAVTNYLAC